MWKKYSNNFKVQEVEDVLNKMLNNDVYEYLSEDINDEIYEEDKVILDDILSKYLKCDKSIIEDTDVIYIDRNLGFISLYKYEEIKDV